MKISFIKKFLNSKNYKRFCSEILAILLPLQLMPASQDSTGESDIVFVLKFLKKRAEYGEEILATLS
jgi:hypothetical protein